MVEWKATTTCVDFIQGKLAKYIRHQALCMADMDQVLLQARASTRIRLVLAGGARN